MRHTLPGLQILGSIPSSLCWKVQPATHAEGLFLTYCRSSRGSMRKLSLVDTLQERSSSGLKRGAALTDGCILIALGCTFTPLVFTTTPASIYWNCSLNLHHRVARKLAEHDRTGMCTRQHVDIVATSKLECIIICCA